MPNLYDLNQDDWLPVRSGYVSGTETATLGVSSVESLARFSLRSESRRLVACSVGLRLWDRDGYIG